MMSIPPPPATSASLEPHPAGNVPRLRILIVDDEPLIRWAVVETLVAAGHRVIEAEDGASARRVIAELAAPADVVLLDYRLPDNDDLSLLSDIRRMSPGSAVVMMTAYGSAELGRDARLMGARAVLEKPFDLRVLESVVANAYRDAAAAPPERPPA